MDDTDGFVYVALDEVDLSGMRNPRASIWVHLERSNYEPTDAIRVWATTRLCGEIEIIRAPHLACHRWYMYLCIIDMTWRVPRQRACSTMRRTR